MKHLFIVGGFILLTFSCSGPIPETVAIAKTKTYTQIEKLSWLNGIWERVSEIEISTETWQKKNDSTLYGIALTLEGKDTVALETMTIEQKGNELYFIPIVKNQNQGKAVKFTLTSSSEKEWIFENPKHDFPTKITYAQPVKDSLFAQISAIREGKDVKVSFPFKRKK